MSRNHIEDIRAALERRFTVEREISSGRAAKVYVAQTAAGEPVALKVLHADLHASIESDRFIREMQLLQHLDHPRIARIVSCGVAGGHAYFAMPLLEGPTLKARLKDGPLPVADVRRIAHEVLDALGHAHARGVVHRDVEPGNILLTASGAVLVDFGIARALEAAGADRVTLPGVTVGTAAYMSPEQCAGEMSDGRTDLYSLACVLFEMLGGQPPFHHESPLTVQQMQLRQPPTDVTNLRPDTPKPMAAAIARALAKKPVDRWQDAAAMERALG